MKWGSAAFLNGLIFAVIHPQGLVAMPMLIFFRNEHGMDSGSERDNNCPHCYARMSQWCSNGYVIYLVAGKQCRLAAQRVEWKHGLHIPKQSCNF